MKALRLDDSLNLHNDFPVSQADGEALVQVLFAGICNTDLEIIKGYAGFRGTPGHEFVGRVVEAPDGTLLNKRVVGEINVGCQACSVCLKSDARHCPKRTVLGIKDRDGAFAEYLSLPAANLIEIPDTVTNEEAVFVEPLAAACRIVEQVELDSGTDVCVIGDGKLAQLIVRALAHTACRLTIIGKHRDKLDRVSGIVSQSLLVNGKTEMTTQVLRQTAGRQFDVVVEASGSPAGLPMAVQLVKPLGSIVLKSTHHSPASLDLAPVVVNEVRLLGSRCGKLQPAVALLEKGDVSIRSLISDIFPLDDALIAFDRAAHPSTMKILLKIADL